MRLFASAEPVDRPPPRSARSAKALQEAEEDEETTRLPADSGEAKALTPPSVSIGRLHQDPDHHAVDELRALGLDPRHREASTARLTQGRAQRIGGVQIDLPRHDDNGFVVIIPRFDRVRTCRGWQRRLRCVRWERFATSHDRHFRRIPSSTHNISRYAVQKPRRTSRSPPGRGAGSDAVLTVYASALSAPSWEPFFTGMLTAVGALTGLLFVAISNNLTRIVALPNLVARAGQALWTLVVLLLVCGVALIPQSTSAAGAEVVIVGGLSIGFHGPRHIAWFIRDEVADRWQWALSRLIATFPTFLIAVVGGVQLILGSAKGAYWVAAAVSIGILGVTASSWVLLVEVVRATPPDVGQS